ncbi:Uncharacterized protein EbC_26880 [Erwinia billingiae Eb661]|uniref:Uncharacterized protein n=1 Tax=Erwinia billingiae (strain Eb661) TaxID=634500 RepID=D8MTR2_ERWBE|nr:Uncharacterized protein EbC_26880 [Erwinia billingiae Eb661]
MLRLVALKNIAFIVIQGFQPRSDIAIVLDLSGNIQIRHQERASQPGDPLLKRPPSLASIPFISVFWRFLPRYR